MVKAKKKVAPTKGEELLENPEAIAEQLNKTEQFIEQNKKGVIVVGGVIAALIAGYFFFNYWLTNRNETAQKEMFQAVFYFESDSLERALNGDGNNYGFLQIIDEFSMTDAANLSQYYAGAILLKTGDYNSAIKHLRKFSAKDLVVQARAYSLIGDAYMELHNYNEAVKFYMKAAEYKSNEFTSPPYLIKAAIAYEEMGNYKAAYNCYNIITEKYINSSDYQLARKHKARLENKAG